MGKKKAAKCSLIDELLAAEPRPVKDWFFKLSEDDKQTALRVKELFKANKLKHFRGAPAIAEKMVEAIDTEVSSDVVARWLRK